MSSKRSLIVIEPTTTGYSAYSPDVPGCAAAGDTEDETLRHFQDARCAGWLSWTDVLGTDPHLWW